MKRAALAPALAILAWAPLGHADYLEVRRHAHIKRGAERSSETLVELPIGTLVELRHEPQTNGYYKVRTRDRKNGYVYRTLVRRHRGDLPPAPSPVSPVEDEDTAPAPIADDTTPGVPSRPFDPNEPLGSGGIPEMRAHLINVGQGASMLLEFECGTALIDTGGEKNGSFDSESALSGHLETFFGARPALSRTIDLLVITHPHLDHVANAERVYTDFTVKNVITNGQTTGSGGHQQKLLEEWARAHATLDTIAEAEIPSGGLTNAAIDPIRCQNVDPTVRVLWGTVAQRPSGWNADAFRDENNHSLVLRVDFDEASFLIPGDIEHEAIEHLLEKHGSSVLDVDVLQVSHHGSSNGTTDELLTRVSPQIALLGTGDPVRREDWSAWQHGHPRQDVVDLLAGARRASAGAGGREDGARAVPVQEGGVR
jgi:competence protein ComEC